MRHFIDISLYGPEEIRHVLDLAVRLKAVWKSEGNPPILKGKALGMVFQKPSLRTRVSFEMAMQHLGGHALYLSPDEIGLGKRETVADVARVLSRYVDCIMARVFAHSHIEELAEYSRVPVINGLSDYNHPCQAMADLLTIQEKKGHLEGLNLAFFGDGNNVATSLAFATAQVGMNFAIATPEGYELPERVIAKARKIAEKTGSRILTTHDPEEAARGADVLYTDVWASMGQEEEREKRLRIFPPYQVSARLLALADRNAIVEHCLPAHRGEEIAAEVIDGQHSVVFDQAENRMHAQKAILAHILADM